MKRWHHVLVLLVVPLLSVHAQNNSLRVKFEKDPDRATTIGVFRDKGLIYGSVNNLVEIFSMGVFENKEARKLEIKHTGYRVKLSADNPFVVITDPDGRQTTHQLSANVIYAAKSFFVPLTAFIPLFDQVFTTPIAFDAAQAVITVGKASERPAFDITALSFEPKANGMVIRIPASRSLEEFESWLRPDGWFYVTIADAKADVYTLNRLKPAGLVKKIVAIQSPTSVQLTFKLAGKIAASEIFKEDGSNDIIVSLRKSSENDKILLAKKWQEIQANLEYQRKRWKLDVIVIDAGHGGKDWGAIGVSGVKEKDVTLGVALKLGHLIEKKMKGVKVVYTRKTDSFVELDKRGQIANEAGGKLFISIHCNSLKKKPSVTNGFEVYLLRPGRTAEAIAIAERENSVIELEEGFEKRYQQLTDENFILVTMAQSAHVKASELFADFVQQKMEKVSGLENRGVRQAGFYVLVGAAMPNILVETAYLSNRKDEKFLASSSGQQKIAEALFDAVDEYKEEYEKYFSEGREIGESRVSSGTANRK